MPAGGRPPACATAGPRGPIISGFTLGIQALAYTEGIALRIRDDRAVVPALWVLELTNALRTACIRQRLDAQRAQISLAQLARPPIDVDQHPVPRSPMLARALRFFLGSYGPACLEPVLQAAAVACGVGCVVVGRKPGSAPGRVGSGRVVTINRRAGPLAKWRGTRGRGI
jgi:hypothetical protein